MSGGGGREEKVHLIQIQDIWPPVMKSEKRSISMNFRKNRGQ